MIFLKKLSEIIEETFANRHIGKANMGTMKGALSSLKVSVGVLSFLVSCILGNAHLACKETQGVWGFGTKNTET